MQVGVNLSGGEFGSGSRMNYDYTYPTHGELDYYASKGLDVVRLPVLWERLQPSQNGPLSSGDIGRIADVVHYADTKGIKVILDVHDYGYGYGSLIGSSATPNASFADLWGKLAGQFATDSNVIFGLMNEPHTQNAAQWLDSANMAIDAIRRAGATQEVLVPGSYWDGAWSWVSSDNDTVMGNGIRDSAHNYAFEVHQYLDVDGSGTHASVVSDTIGVERLSAITAWAEATGNKLFLGEFGAGTDATSLSALDKMLGFMNAHQDVWQGATEWGGGPWWGNYMYSVEPTGLNTSSVADKPQIAILSKYATMSEPSVQEPHGSAAPGPASVAAGNAPVSASSAPAAASPVTQHPVQLRRTSQRVGPPVQTLRRRAGGPRGLRRKPPREHRSLEAGRTGRRPERRRHGIRLREQGARQVGDPRTGRDGHDRSGEPWRGRRHPRGRNLYRPLRRFRASIEGIAQR